jgi:hypothetical protein
VILIFPFSTYNELVPISHHLPALIICPLHLAVKTIKDWCDFTLINSTYQLLHHVAKKITKILLLKRGISCDEATKSRGVGSAKKTCN